MPGMIPFPKRSAKASDFLPKIPGIVHHFGDTASIGRDVPFVRKKEPVFARFLGVDALHSTWLDAPNSRAGLAVC